MAIDSLKEMHNDFMVYATEVNNNRAFPDAIDGLKPGMRAALYTMFRKGFTSNKPHVKSAKITGAVIGELWPHGDSSVYEAIVRMSQPWVNNIPEIDWHGANGSLLGGPQAASSRYTECRLSEASEDGFFKNIKKNVVDMIPNFSEDDEWPKVFPAIFPRLFINGSQGIGYTIAQEWEPGNLNEFFNKVKEYLKTGKVDCSDIYPDYPTGGIIINKKDIKTIYETGKGTVILRGDVTIDGNLIKITELPYQVYVEPFIQKVKELVNNNQLSGIDDICNKSDDSGMLIEIECSDDPTLVLSNLYKLTDLQTSFSANQMALINGIPELLTLKDYIDIYVKANVEFITKEYETDLNTALSRVEIINGLLKAILNIDNIIKEIKKSKDSTDAKNNLVKKFKFTDNQAKAIVDMKLGKLAHLEGVELENEKVTLDKTISNCNKLLGSEKLKKKELINRLEKFVTKYGWARRTSVCDVDIKVEKATVKAVKTVKVNNEQFMILLTKGNTIKRVSLTNYRPQVKITNESDRVIKAIKVGARDKFVLVSNLGKMYKLQCNKINIGSMTSAGAELDTLLNLNDSETILNIFTSSSDIENLFIVTKNGKVKKIKSENVLGISKTIGTVIMKLDDNDEIIFTELASEGDEFKFNVGKKVVTLSVSKFKAKGRSAGGVSGIKLKKGDNIIKWEK